MRHDDSGSHRIGGPDDGASSRRAAKKRPTWLRWLLPLLALLFLLLVLAFCGDNDRDGSPDSVDQIGNEQAERDCGDAVAGDKGVGDSVSPDDTCETD